MRNTFFAQTLRGGQHGKFLDDACAPLLHPLATGWRPGSRSIDCNRRASRSLPRDPLSLNRRIRRATCVLEQSRKFAVCFNGTDVD
jgi:hypothetical protein